MPAPLHIVLTAEEDRTLSELRVATTLSQRTRDRVHMLRLNAQGWTVPAIAEIFDCQENTVRRTLQRRRHKWLRGTLGCRWTGSQSQVARSRDALFGTMLRTTTEDLQQSTTVSEARARVTSRPQC